MYSTGLLVGMYRIGGDRRRHRREVISASATPFWDSNHATSRHLAVRIDV
jgi:hypothetical protein